MAEWLFEIRDQDDLNPIRLTTATDLKWEAALNAPGQASFRIDLNSEEAIEANLAESRSRLYVYRDGDLKFSGVIMVVERYFDEKSQYANVRALGWLWFFGKRGLAGAGDVTQTGVDAGALASALILAAQDPAEYEDLGVTEGEIETSENINITFSRTTIKQGIELIQEMVGIEYEITPQKLFNVYYPHKGTDRSSTVKFKYPGNIKSGRSISDATTLINWSRFFGYGLGAIELRNNIYDDDSRAVYGAYEGYFSRKEIKEQAVLDDVATNFIALNKQPRLTVDITVDGNDPDVNLSDYNIGDSVRVIFDHENYSLTQIFRVFEIHAEISESNIESVRLVLALI